MAIGEGLQFSFVYHSFTENALQAVAVGTFIDKPCCLYLKRKLL